MLQKPLVSLLDPGLVVVAATGVKRPRLPRAAEVVDAIEDRLDGGRVAVGGGLVAHHTGAGHVYVLCIFELRGAVRDELVPLKIPRLAVAALDVGAIRVAELQDCVRCGDLGEPLPVVFIG